MKLFRSFTSLQTVSWVLIIVCSPYGLSRIERFYLSRLSVIVVPGHFVHFTSPFFLLSLILLRSYLPTVVHSFVTFPLFFALFLFFFLFSSLSGYTVLQPCPFQHMVVLPVVVVLWLGAIRLPLYIRLCTKLVHICGTTRRISILTVLAGYRLLGPR